MILPINTLIDSRFVINRFLASGGMAEIYEAFDTYTQKAVALKVIKADLQDNDLELERFENEARYTAMFSHPHIIKIFNVGTYQKYFFISYELMKGRTVKSFLDERGFLSEKEAIDYLLQVLEATKHIHERGIIHNDIKPENLFLFYDGNIKLLDFGIATHIDDEIDKTINASVIYTAPEVLRYKHLSIQSDIYSLGTVLFEFLTGKTPYMRKNTKDEINAHLYENIPSISKYLNVKNYKSFDYVIARATNRNLDKRYKNDQEMIDDLLKIKNEGSVKRKNIFERLFKK